MKPDRIPKPVRSFLLYCRKQTIIFVHTHHLTGALPNYFTDKTNFIWTVADDVLRGAFMVHEYGYVNLPFVVLRSLASEMGR